MGLFSRARDTDEAIEMTRKLASGKGVLGGLTRMTVGSEGIAKLQAAMPAIDQARQAQLEMEAQAAAYGGQAAAQQAQAAMYAQAAMQAQGFSMVQAQIVSVADTGRQVNALPIAIVNVMLNDGSQTQLQFETAVSPTQIPKVGDIVNLSPRADVPQGYLYMGPAV